MLEYLEAATVSKYIGLIICILSASTYLCSFTPFELFYSSKLIRKGEYWRLFSSVFYFGELSAPTTLFLFDFLNFASLVETGAFSRRKFDLILFYLFGIICMWIVAPFTKTTFFSNMLTSYVTYYWSKLFSDQKISIAGFPIPVPGKYAPFLIALMSYNRNGLIAIIDTLVGFLIGQLYYVSRSIFTLTLFHTTNWLRTALHVVSKDD